MVSLDPAHLFGAVLSLVSRAARRTVRKPSFGFETLPAASPSLMLFKTPLEPIFLHVRCLTRLFQYPLAGILRYHCVGRKGGQMRLVRSSGCQSRAQGSKVLAASFDNMFDDHVAIWHSLRSSPHHRLAHRRLIRRAAWLGGQFGDRGE
ncbi:hypothetical protein D7B24_001635 [Verticillium nonalfalfae]|uniref:Uncharacterized protein n=1 Tax=Verticillium nonalfalfae TaxID=1051616 RepID=A0A3M9XZE2_9PEZI|nr:uncharacterized protein D7B24_001635 [Verticillium nonalfalfae]RNJ53623.1 hypothetical protein D7B24_001635 [Verticillium nonalfalfae]